MRCDEFLATVDTYLDDELSIVDWLRMRGHVLLCERCRRLIASEVTLHALLATDAMADQPSAALRERIIQEIRRIHTDGDGPSIPELGSPAPGSQFSPRWSGASPPDREANGNHARP
jgi:mycothiol system anti-sigma-R factor